MGVVVVGDVGKVELVEIILNLTSGHIRLEEKVKWKWGKVQVTSCCCCCLC